ncbi:MAG TPA: 2-dehydropantoate 2-reductase [Opitutaceae bacterium]|jgi:2-dehydropantoate 2-reductase|nr:2-dehydropantoate 2-reductase [Opitutaceae bacterium]
MVNQFPKVAIVGSGAIGTYYGAKLALAGTEVRFLMRSDLATVRARGSLLLHEKAGTTELRPVAAFGAAEEIGPVDLVIVMLKTTANGVFASLLPPLLGQRTAVFTLQNGLGSDEQLAALFGAERVMGGLAFIAATRTAPGEVTCYHPGSIALGEFGRPAQDRTRALAAQFAAAGVKTRVVDDLPGARWHKLVWNIPFNGLTITAGGITTDRLCADPLRAEEVRALMREVQLAAGRLGFVIPDEFLREQFDVTPPMGAYRPSSLVDFQAGREVEVEAIWGEPLRRAQAAGASVPRLEKLYALLKKLTVR